MSKSIKIRDIEAGPGEKTYGFLNVAETAIMDVKIPVMIVNGSEPGPKLCIVAGTHSMEYEGIEAVVRTFQDTNPTTLKGTLIMCPVLNTPGFQQGVPYLNPLDGKNMNRVYPGNPDGTISEKMIHVVFNELIRGCDWHIDLHGGDAVEDLVRCVIYDLEIGTEEVDVKTAEMAKYFLPGIIREFKGGLANSSSTEVLKLGIPSITTEAGALGAYREDDIQYQYRGVKNVMKWLGMLPEPPQEPEDSKVVTQTASVKIKHGGIFYPHAQIGDYVKKGDLLAEIKDMFGNVREKIYVPIDGMAAMMYPKRVKIAGDSIYSIWGF